MYQLLIFALASAWLIRNCSVNVCSVSFSLWYLQCVCIMFRICVFILVIILFCSIKVLSYLMLFLVTQISYIICIIANVNFLVFLFSLLTLSVSKCCSELQFFPVSLVSIGLQYVQISFILGHFVKRCMLSSVCQQWSHFGFISFVILCRYWFVFVEQCRSL